MSLIKCSIIFWLQNIYAFVLNNTKFNAINMFVLAILSKIISGHKIFCMWWCPWRDYAVIKWFHLLDSFVSFVIIFLLLGCHPALIWKFLSSLIYLVMTCLVGILGGLFFSEGKRSRSGEKLSWGMGLGNRRIWGRRNWVRDVKYDRRINFKKSEVYFVRY